MGFIMTISVQEISDRLEINNLLIDYCTAVDNRDIDQFDVIFTADAQIDYTAMGGAKGNREEIKAYLKKVLPNFVRSQHMIANSRVWLDGDTARARTMCHNPMVLAGDDGKEHVIFYGLWYVDRLVRTAEGWRIEERVEEFGYEYNVPDSFQPPQ